MSDGTDSPDPQGPALGLIAGLAFAIAILCLVSFVVFGA
jgi:hypothetical protein